MSRLKPILMIALLAVSAGWAAAVFQMVQSRAERRQDAGAQRLGWREIAWPFPRDGWPAGRAFRCQQTSCVPGSEIYVRAKIGFCNCDTGVADDDEVDRVTDLDLVSPGFRPRAAGQAVRVADMTGRSRSYDLGFADGRHGAIGFALSHRCNLMVAVMQGRAVDPLLQQAAQQFLVAPAMQRWMMAAVGGT